MNNKRLYTSYIAEIAFITGVLMESRQIEVEISDIEGAYYFYSHVYKKWMKSDEKDITEFTRDWLLENYGTKEESVI